MTFYERYELLCTERSIKPQTQEILDFLGVTSPTVSGWKRGSLPKGELICRLSEYFNVTADFLLGLSELRDRAISLSAEEMLLLSAYREADTQGRFHIIQVCMNEREAAEKRNAVSAG